MKRLIVVVALLAVVMMSAAVALARPINVGGNFCASIEKTKCAGPKRCLGNGNPFEVEETLTLFSPINVGGN